MIWPRRRRTAGPGRRRRVEKRIERVSLGDLRPDPVAFLGRSAYLELALFETASAVAGRATALADREAITRVAAAILGQHTGLVALLTERGVDATSAMRAYTADIERYRRRLGDAGWYEAVLTLHLTTGLLDDFFARLAAGLPAADAGRTAAILHADIGHEPLVSILREAVSADRRLASRLALWGRRLVGDTLLVARSALEDARTASGSPTESDEHRVEPVLGELIAAHTRRMDELGLTA